METNRVLVDFDRLSQFFPHGVARATDLVALGLTSEHIRHRCGPDGPWRRLDDKVVLLHDSKPAREHRLLAALGVAEPGAVVTGREAMWLHGVPVRALGAIHLLVDSRGHERHDGSVVVERTAHLPEPLWRGRFPVASLARATVDACRRTPSFGEVQVLVAEAVQRGGVPLDALHRELAGGAKKGTSTLRSVLAEVDRKHRRASARAAREVLHGAGLPHPVWNVRLSRPDGVHLGTVDAWWPDVGLAWDADIYRPWEPRPENATSTRLSRYLGAGIVAVHTVPSRLRADSASVIAELRAAYRLAMVAPHPEVVGDR